MSRRLGILTALVLATTPLVAGGVADAAPRCFGAASRDPSRRCDNPALRMAVVPTPANAIITPNAYCSLGKRRGLVLPCAFGASSGQATSTMALVGDSHAMHWRGALEVVAQARRWRGISVTRASCPFTRAKTLLKTDALTAACVRWNRDARAWFSRHPEVRTVFLSANSRDHYAGDRGLAGFTTALRGLPRTVRTIFILRDTPATAHVAASVHSDVACQVKRPSGRPAARGVKVATSVWSSGRDTKPSTGLSPR